MKKVLLVGPILSRSGYGEMARFAFRSLINEPNVDLYLHGTTWGKSGWIWADDDERKLIDSLLQKTVFFRQQGGVFDASIQCTIPNEWQKLTAYDIGYTAGIETDKVAPEWLLAANEKVDKIITISNHSRNVYLSSKYDAHNQETNEPIKDYKCETPIDVCGFPVREIEAEELEINLRHDFNFLCVAQMGPRKNIDAVINNFIEEFKNEDVGLLLKVHAANDSILDYYNIKDSFERITQVAKDEEWACSINVLHGNLSDNQMQGLYQHPKVKATVSLTHGEGFGLPLYEAASNGIPVVATNWSGHLDFLTHTEIQDISGAGKVAGKKRTKGKIGRNKIINMFAAVKYKLEPIPEHVVWNGVLNAGTNWAYVDDTDAKKKMRDVYKNYTKWKKKADTLADTLNSVSNEEYYKKFIVSTGIDFDDEDEEEFIL